MITSRAKRKTKQRPLSKTRKALQKIIGQPLTFGAALRAHRMSEDMSQVELARLMDMSKAQLCDIEKERRTVSPERAAQFAKVLGYSVEHFVQLAIEDQLQKAGLQLHVHIESPKHTSWKQPPSYVKRQAIPQTSHAGHGL